MIVQNGMPRKPVPLTNLPIHLTVRCQNREAFPLPIEEVWKTFERYLYFIHHSYGIEIHSFVLMPNHIHMLLSDPLLCRSKALLYLLREVSRSINLDCGQINHIWGQRNYPCEIDSDIYFRTAYKYVYLNPVKARICKNVWDYPYSSLRGILGFQRSILPIRDPFLFEGNISRTIDWLNTRPSKEIWEDVAIALKKKCFKLPRKGNHLHPLNQGLEF